MRILLYLAAALAAWLAYEAFIRPPTPVAPQSSVAGLSPAEQEYYRKVFDYTMTNIKAGQSYDWESHGGKGTISPGTPFVSKLQSTCRAFSEYVRINQVEETRDGIACRREGGEGWCRLRKDQALTCALETPAMQSGAGGSGVNVGVPSINAPSGRYGGGGGGVNPGTPGIDPARGGEAPKGGDIADTVTGTAGDAAGKATGGAIEWFRGTFR